MKKLFKFKKSRSLALKFDLKMRLTTLFLITSLFQLQANEVYSQKTKVTLNLEKVSVEKVLNKIESLTEFKFLYNYSEIDYKRETSIKAEEELIFSVLEHLFSNSNITFEVLDKQIILKKKKLIDNNPNNQSTVIKKQQPMINGQIADQNGQPLPGVNIVQKGTTNGVSSDFDGNYSISLIESNEYVLVFSYIGFLTQEVSVTNQTTVDVKLVEDAAALDEVVVVGYGTARRKDVAGSVSTVDVENSPIANISSSNALQSIQGQAAGINITPQNSPGTTPSILVRGQNSINGSNDPLIVLDGIIFLGSIQDINPSDIASFDILKDASAAAAYGSRSANGVIMITTKKGKSDKPLIKISASTGFNTWNNKFNMMGLSDYEQKYASQTNQAVGSIIFDDETRNQYLAQRVDTDWMDLISRTGVIHNQQVSVSGSTDKVNYYFSGGYNKEEGVIIGDDYQRISLRTRLNTNITDWLEVGIDGTYNNNDYSGIGADMELAYQMAPIGHPYRFDSMPNDVNSSNSRLLERYPTGSSVQSPLWGTDGTVEDKDKSDFFRFAGYLSLKIPKIEGLSYRFNYSINSNNYTRDRFYYEDYYVGEAGAGNYIERYSPTSLQTRLTQANGYNTRINNYTYILDNILNYKRTFGDHYVDMTLVATRDYTYEKEVTLNGSDYSANGNTELGLNGIHKATILNSSLNVLEKSNIGYLARLSYTLKDKYHLNASIRRDGSSVFGADKKWGNFPSVGLAWTISNEDFLANNKFINYMKLKASYGKNGNQGIDAYGTLARVNSGSDGGIRYEFGDNPSSILYGVQLSSLANPNLGWETTTAFNSGFQSRLLDNKISLDVDFYFSKTTDQIFLRNIPIMTGFETILSSLGQIDNSGLEINLGSTNIKTDNFTWTSNLNYWKNRNKLASLYGDDLDGDGVEDDDLSNGLFIGKSLGAIYGYEFTGVVQEDDTDYITKNGATPGDPKFRDLDGDGVINADDDRKILGYRKENFRMSLSNTFTHKDFSLYVLLTGAFGGGKDNFYASENPLATSFRDRFDTNEINHPWWTPENKSNKYLRSDYTGGRYLGLQSRGFVRIQDISLSYNIPEKLISKIGINSVKLYTSIHNLHTFTNWFGGGDPELGIRPGDNTYAVPTTFTIGINASL